MRPSRMAVISHSIQENRQVFKVDATPCVAERWMQRKALLKEVLFVSGFQIPDLNMGGIVWLSLRKGNFGLTFTAGVATFWGGVKLSGGVSLLALIVHTFLACRTIVIFSTSWDT